MVTSGAMDLFPAFLRRFVINVAHEFLGRLAAYQYRIMEASKVGTTPYDETVAILALKIVVL
jgi:hypothetical protein